MDLTAHSGGSHGGLDWDPGLGIGGKTECFGMI